MISVLDAFSVLLSFYGVFFFTYVFFSIEKIGSVHAILNFVSSHFMLTLIAKCDVLIWFFIMSFKSEEGSSHVLRAEIAFDYK